MSSATSQFYPYRASLEAFLGVLTTRSYTSSVETDRLRLVAGQIHKLAKEIISSQNPFIDIQMYLPGKPWLPKLKPEFELRDLKNRLNQILKSLRSEKVTGSPSVRRNSVVESCEKVLASVRAISRLIKLETTYYFYDNDRVCPAGIRERNRDRLTLQLFTRKVARQCLL